MQSLEDIVSKIDTPLFHSIGEAADSIDRPCYAVGGCVRDLFLQRPSKDFDFVTVGSGIELAEIVASRLGRGAHLNVFRNFGTAQVKRHDIELEFVGARRESYDRNSRKPVVEDGTLEEDLSRRDFTVNALALSVNRNSFGQLVDLFDGLGDMERRILRTPLDPDVTFSDDPLRMMRAIRFATQLDFTILPETFEAIRRNAERIRIISKERIVDELMKIMQAPRPSVGWDLLLKSGLLAIIFPELAAMKGVDVVNGRGHKDNFYHTMAVLDNVAEKSDDVWLRWGALMHDIAKPVTKRWDEKIGWTFHNHNFIGAKMVPRIFRRMRLPQDAKMKYVAKMVELHMRPIALVEDEVTDSAVRRLIHDAGDDIEDLMALCEADITSKNQEKVRRILDNFALVRQKMVDLNERDHIRNFKPPVDGTEIMETFGISGGPVVGQIKSAIKNAVLDGVIHNDHEEARQLMLRLAAEQGLFPVNGSSD
ncbi:MAG: CCA tRNA nucleotidyltransferase [Duncaniella sp.]|uniref:CCA tRNA nucleotidyltransferase n=1 Tax=Duncaniella sp. TaxID=2518496 RepID=UPI0023CB1E85|nr:HD domain-containing protein [Duncaniella sp.]MDE5988439.1 CCA tRNA nucleotidyltransferase [Duncaniella sp.]MDE6174203.1 CCA tRNA nucleotidyltransferase [Duncaniella sp.]